MKCVVSGGVSRLICSDRQLGKTDVEMGQDAFIFTPAATYMTSCFEEELRTKMCKRGVRLISSNKIPDDHKTPLVLICNNVSTIGKDIESTLNRSSCEKFDILYLIVLHAGGANHMPISKTKDRFGKDACLKNYSSIREIIDIAYTPENGIYRCDMNKQALNQLEEVKPTSQKSWTVPSFSVSFSCFVSMAFILRTLLYVYGGCSTFST